MNTFGVIDRVVHRGMTCICVAVAVVLGVIALEPTASAQVYNPITNCYDSTDGNASFCPGGGGGGGGGGRPVPHIDPCFLAQNAMRPCTSQPSKPVGVDPNLVGTWKLPLNGGPWVWEIHRDGTYSFHSEAGDGAPPTAGAFSARNGHWSLKATNGYTDGGTYSLQTSDTCSWTGQLGTAAWRRYSSNAASGQTEPSGTGQPETARPVRR